MSEKFYLAYKDDLDNICVTNLKKLQDTSEPSKFYAQLVNVTANGCKLRVVGNNDVYVKSGTYYWAAYK